MGKRAIMARLLLLACQALMAALWAGPVHAYEIWVRNSSASWVRVEAFVVGPDLDLLGLGEKEIAPGGQAHWDSKGRCLGGLAGRVRTSQGWAALNETSCLGAVRPRHDWTACCRDLSFGVCHPPGKDARFCLE